MTTPKQFRIGAAVVWRTMFGDWRYGVYLGVCQYDRTLANVRSHNGIVTVERTALS